MTSMLKELSWRTLEQRRTDRSLAVLYKIVHFLANEQDAGHVPSLEGLPISTTRTESYTSKDAIAVPRPVSFIPSFVRNL